MRLLFLVCLFLSRPALAETAHDPGVRTGRARAGNILAGFSLIESIILLRGRTEFGRTHGVPQGLGPVFNGDSCVACHSQPAIGGSSGAVNPQFAIAAKAGAHNQVPSFLSATGPVRVARFRYRTNVNGALTDTRDGGVHSIFSIAGRSDAGAWASGSFSSTTGGRMTFSRRSCSTPVRRTPAFPLRKPTRWSRNTLS